MRQNTSSVGPTSPPTSFSVIGTLLAALVLSLAVVCAALALLYPALTVGFVAGGATASLVPVAARHLSGTSLTDAQATAVRVPFTNRRVEV